ncbi:MAG: hypothetical protein COT92_00140 [Candidatus Doudnabacteria bacterium CG10_big_fil_rev_8_21_14_0_10_42_18]|uniref:Transcobalamin-like C-terminal domain-containing protein n=1 Tax=Candidatus Doudnabacteria bacterium CG10_big_fil_rev_8_21_14_0_10_42_18 TaxID=1974552 RepID=A0A2H0VBX9_9BACT|nr:MAG: hypothetical protein COT92_00140 [Candidatus Doudnabacteria bacterium CG10_big_fil_rev_8_21_14_0_10_42_18]
MKKFFKLILLSFVLVLAAAGCAQKQASDEVSQIFKNERQAIQIVHKVEGDMGDQLFNFYPEENKSALDLLKSGHQVETKSFSGVGEYVESINGKKADGTSEFWALYVNGQQAQVGASSYYPKNEDKIEWKLEKVE